jgi:hypothetical protein
MLAAITAGTAVCCFAVSYGIHQIIPVTPITDEDAISNKSTYGTYNLLSKDELKTKNVQELIDTYLNKRASLDAVLMTVTGKTTLKDAHAEIVNKVKTLPSGEEHARFVFLQKAAEEHYPEVKPPPPPPEQDPEPEVAPVNKPQMGGGHLRFSVSIKRRSLRQRHARPPIALEM